MTLQDFFRQHRRVLLAFSGGADSAYLLWCAKQLGAEVEPCFVRSPFQPAFELEDARRLCRELGVELSLLELPVLSDPKIKANCAERCYYCKRAIFSLLLEEAKRRGIDCVIDGTNASDKDDERPGMRALRELGILSPLRLAGISKPVLRSLSHQAGLFTAGKPAYACLATRIPTGHSISLDLLKRIEQGEAILSDMGYVNFRLRLRDEGALLQLDQTQLEYGKKHLTEIRLRLSELFSSLDIDSAGRRGEEGTATAVPKDHT